MNFKCHSKPRSCACYCLYIKIPFWRVLFSPVACFSQFKAHNLNVGYISFVPNIFLAAICILIQVYKQVQNYATFIASVAVALKARAKAYLLLWLPSGKSIFSPFLSLSPLNGCQGRRHLSRCASFRYVHIYLCLYRR